MAHKPLTPIEPIDPVIEQMRNNMAEYLENPPESVAPPVPTPLRVAFASCPPSKMTPPVVSAILRYDYERRQEGAIKFQGRRIFIGE